MVVCFFWQDALDQKSHCQQDDKIFGWTMDNFFFFQTTISSVYLFSGRLISIEGLGLILLTHGIMIAEPQSWDVFTPLFLEPLAIKLASDATNIT